MESKYDLIGGKSSSKFSLKFKPTPIIFHGKNGPPSPKKIKLNNGTSENQVSINSNSNFGNKSKISIQEQRRKLPVFHNRNKLLDLIKRHQTLIILGETGCGKTTQIPQYINSARLQGNGKIAVTQPRRVAAISIANRVCQEIGNGVRRNILIISNEGNMLTFKKMIGEIVGYTVRFEDVTSKNTKIVYLTDGMLLREALSDSLLMEYTVIILDEAHERTIHTDVLFGIVKKAQRIRIEKDLTPLKVLIMSATMDVDHFSKYFECKAVYLEGRAYPVNIFYTKSLQEDYQTACVATFFKIHKQAPPDEDVLIFLTGQEEIEAVSYQIRLLAKDPEVNGPAVRVFPLYASQPSTQQISVFQSVPENTRKVIVSTNVAETSITITGVKHVIDGGMVKVRSYHPTTGLDALKVQRISQEEAWQRTGRAGRTSEGNCYRIYTKFQYECLKKVKTPEIQRCNLSTVVLQLLALKINALHFDFMDKPAKESLLSAFEQLKMLGAVKDVDSGKLTELGSQMALFPLDPRFSKILLSAPNYGCLEEVLTIVAILSGESILLNPPAKRDQAQALQQKFYSAYGDHIMLLNAFREYTNVGQSNKRSWCHEHYINMRNIAYAREVRTQLSDICKRCQIPSSSCGSNMDQVRKCLLAGLFMNVAELHRDRNYITLDKRQIVSIHPSSCIHSQKPACVLFTEVVQTSKCYLRSLTTINIEWLQEIVPDYVRIRNIKCVN